MCPTPGMMLRITATASLALPSAVSVAPRVQSHRSQLCASFGSRCPQNGHAILAPVLGSGRIAGASVYSTLISVLDSHKWHGIRQANLQLAATPPRYGLAVKGLKRTFLLLLAFFFTAFGDGPRCYSNVEHR